MRYVLLLVLVGLLWAPAAQGRDTFVIAADSSGDPGYVGIGVIASVGVTEVVIGERIDGEDVDIAEVETEPFGAAAPGLAFGFHKRAAKWDCDRLSRHFNARGIDSDGEKITTGVWNRTPSCRNRLAVHAPARVAPGAEVPVRVRDTFKSGGIDGRVCLTAPSGDDDCHPLDLPDGTKRFETTFQPKRRGHWSLTVRTPEQRVRRNLAVGVRARPGSRLPVILATGDSQMQSLDALVADGLTNRAWVQSDVHNGSGLIQPEPVDWRTLPEEQTAKGVPDATIVAIGANDAGRMKTPDGEEVACCGPAWTFEYARRVEETMRAYTADGRGHVFWLTTPAARDARRNEAAAAVDQAGIGAAAQVPRAHIIDMAAIFTPDGRFHNRIKYRGKRVDVRATDGVHLSIAGAEIAAEAVINALEDENIVRGVDNPTSRRR